MSTDNIFNQADKYIKKFKDMPIAKQSLIATTVIGTLIALVGNYKNIKTVVIDLIDKYKNSENVQEFIKDITALIQPVIDKVKGYFE